MYSEGFDDYATARCRLADGAATLKFATSEVGQGFVVIAGQIARTVLGVDTVELEQIDTEIGSAGSTSASRQTWMSGGAVDSACREVRERLFEYVAAQHGLDPVQLGIDGTDVVDTVGTLRLPVAEVTRGQVFEETVEFRHRPTEELDEDGQGNVHTAFAFAAHRAVVDVDVELGLVKVVELACTQDVGKAINPEAVVGQIQGGSAQGLGLAIMEEIVVKDGIIKNPSFTDYLIPTIMDMPPMKIDVLEYADPHAPYGLRGVGEAPTISSGPAVLAAIRDATGLDLPRVPVRPEHITATLLDLG
ncbi:MAG: xanthine dehydrogenase family protein molybdopterin-binding subunit, partial [Geodermatophilaceae bacterium]